MVVDRRGCRRVRDYDRLWRELNVFWLGLGDRLRRQFLQDGGLPFTDVYTACCRARLDGSCAPMLLPGKAASAVAA